MAVRVCVLALLGAVTALAGPLGLELRYHAAPNRPNALDQTAHTIVPVLAQVDLDLAARLTETGADLQALSYKAEASWNPVSFATLGLRLFHGLELRDATSETDLLPSLRLVAMPFGFLGAFVSVGWYFRFTQLSKVLVLPTPWRSSTSEQDFALELGFRVIPVDGWTATLRVATFEELDVFNLNNPFAEVAVLQRPRGADWSALLFARYQILLGFGRLDELMLGAGVLLGL